MFGLLVVLALLLGTFGTAFAQDVPAPYCGSLSAEDCDILKASQEAMMGLQSYKAAATYGVTLTGIPGLPAPEIAVNVAVDGAVSMDDAALAAVQDMAGKTQAEITAMLAEDGTPLVDLLSGLSLDMTISAEMTPELADLLSAQSGGFTVPATLSVGVILVDGVVYVDLSELAPIVAGIPEGWIGIPVADLVKAQVDAGVLAAAAAQMDPSQLDPSTAAVLGVQSMLMGDMKAFEEFITVERGDDVNGGKSAVFNTMIDVAGLIASPAFADIVKTLSASGALGADVTAADIDQVLSMLPMIGPMIFQGLEVGGSTTIGLTDNYVEEASQGIKWDLAGILQMAAMSGQLPAGIDASAPMMIDIATDVVNSDFDADQGITAPADAMVIPLESLTGAPAQ